MIPLLLGRHVRGFGQEENKFVRVLARVRYASKKPGNCVLGWAVGQAEREQELMWICFHQSTAEDTIVQ